jgi:hypothetical protein
MIDDVIIASLVEDWLEKERVVANIFVAFVVAVKRL